MHVLGLPGFRILDGAPSEYRNPSGGRGVPVRVPITQALRGPPSYLKMTINWLRRGPVSRMRRPTWPRGFANCTMGQS